MARILSLLFNSQCDPSKLYECSEAHFIYMILITHKRLL